MSTTTSTTETYDVLGMTCDHCARSVTEEVSAVPGVSDVARAKEIIRATAQLAVLAVQLGLVDNAVALEEPAEGHRLATVPQSCS